MVMTDDSSAGNFGIPIIQSTIILHVRINRDRWTQHTHNNKNLYTHFSIDELSSHHENHFYFFTLWIFFFCASGFALIVVVCTLSLLVTLLPDRNRFIIEVSMRVCCFFSILSQFFAAYFLFCTCKANCCVARTHLEYNKSYWMCCCCCWVTDFDVSDTRYNIRIRIPCVRVHSRDYQYI